MPGRFPLTISGEKMRGGDMPAKLDRCVKKVKAQLKKKGKKGNAWAICKASMKKKK